MSPASRTNTPGAGERPPGQHDASPHDASPHGPRRSRTVVLAAGCFWCLDSLARRLAGVTAVRSVYTGGTGPDEYIAVCSGTTGHAEAVEITYEPDTLPTEVLLDVFFSCHDPTSLNRQGYDVGTQYRSAMFYADRTEREEFAEAVARVQAAYDRPIVTTLEPLGRVFEAEPEHQGFHLRRPDVGYCRVIIDPKVSALRQRYAPWLRDGALV